MTIVGIDEDVKRAAIDLRRKHRLRVPDAIIAATAVVVRAELLTNDAAMTQIGALNSRAMALK